MPRLGAHLSIAGGVYRAVDRAVASGCEALQIFTKSAGQWRARPLPPEEIALFRRRVRESRVRPVVAHNSYLINVAAADRALRTRSIESLIEELDRAEALALDGLVMHPGSFTSGTEDGGLRLIAEALVLLVWRREGPTLPQAAIAGLLLGVAVTFRDQELIMIVPAALYVLLLRGRRLVRLAALTGCFLLPVVGYLGWFDAAHGHWNFTTFDGAPIDIFVTIPPEKVISHAGLLRMIVGILLTTIMRRTEIPEQRTVMIIDEAAQLVALGLSECSLAQTLRPFLAAADDRLVQ